MYRISTLSLLFLILGSCLQAQEKLEFRQVDSLTLSYYEQARWGELEVLGEQAAKQGFDYYYFNVRLGVAHYKLKQYYDAEKYFKRALKSNPASQLVIEYLYWTYLLRGDYWLADGEYLAANEETRLWLTPVTKIPLAYIYAEAGMKLSNNSDSAGNVSYFNLGAYHKFSPAFGLYHAYTYMGQENFTGRYNQHQYYVAPNYNLCKNVRLQLGLHYLHNVSDLGFGFSSESVEIIDTSTPQVEIITRNDGDYDGDFLVQTFYGELGATIELGRLTLTPSIGYFSERSDPDYRIQNEQITITTVGDPPLPPISITTDTALITSTFVADTIVNQYLPALGISYLPPIFDNRLQLAVNLLVPITEDESHFVFSPSVTAQLSENLSLSGSYLKKEDYLLAENAGSIVYNASFVESEIISLTAAIQLKQKSELYITFQNETVEDNLRLIDYTLNNFIVGIKF